MYASLNARAAGLALTPEETIDLAAAHGFGGVDLLVRDLVDSGARTTPLRFRIEDAGLRGGAFPLPMNWRSSVAEFQRDLRRLPRYAGEAANLGLTRTGTWVLPEIPGTLPISDGPHRLNDAVTLHLDRLRAIARVLDVHGIQLGLEVIGVASARSGQGEPFVTRLGDLDRVLGAIWNEASNLGILADGFHLYAAGESPAAALAWGIRRVVWVHVADLPAGAPPDREAILDHDRGLPGEHPAVGTAAFLKALADDGYRGPVTPEPMAGCRSLAGLEPARVVGRLAESLRSVWPVRTDRLVT